MRNRTANQRCFEGERQAIVWLKVVTTWVSAMPDSGSECLHERAIGWSAEVLRASVGLRAFCSDDFFHHTGQHPLLGRMYLPAQWAGAEKIAQLRRTHRPDQIGPDIAGNLRLLRAGRPDHGR